MNKKGFTLIELLAVIIILGILMIIAIPSVTNYINNSRKSAYIDTAKEIISGARNLVNEGKVPMYDTSATYYIKASCISTENGQKSPYGNFVDEETYVIVTYDGNGYDYYWVSRDETGQGIPTVTALKDLDEDKIQSDIALGTIIPIKISDDKANVQVINETCNGFISSGEGGSGATPGANKICKRAISLHTATCNQSGTYGCKGNPSTSTTITYGNENTTTGTLIPGDAFDCDINNDGTYDDATERFYYVSNYYDVNANTPGFDNSKATLVYYTNVTGGTASQTNHSYSTQASAINSGYTCTQYYGCNNYGPLVAYEQLPTTTQWSNNQIIAPGTRQIKNENGTTTTSGGAIASFLYNDKAARLLTYQEVQQACGSSITNFSDLDNCYYLMENLGFDGSASTYGYWLETPRSDSDYSVWNLSGFSRVIDGIYEANYFDGVRPAITVSKSNISY